MSLSDRRTFLAGCAASTLGCLGDPFLAWAQPPGERGVRPNSVTVVNPRRRVPVSLIVDDSTCLVNLAHFAIPQFAEVFPDRYRQDWRRLPREIPDAFVRKFADWSEETGVQGKYSVVPYPACVGWVDREMPGWTRRELESSLDLVRTRLAPRWDIHPEMVSHTWVIDPRTGRPLPERSRRTMENWDWTRDRSVDELADYMAYALRLLKNAGLPCEGITTPGGFGNQVLDALSRATLEACRDVFGVQLAHYFRHIVTDAKSVAPRVESAAGLMGGDPRAVVSIIGCTGDWFGGWDGLETPSAEKYCSEDGTQGRLPEVIDRDEPAILVCHWPGIYCNGTESGFQALREVVDRLGRVRRDLIWMKISQVARYGAARELTTFDRAGDQLALRAPFACEDFTFLIQDVAGTRPVLQAGGNELALEPVETGRPIATGQFQRTGRDVTVCIKLPQGQSRLIWK